MSKRTNETNRCVLSIFKLCKQQEKLQHFSKSYKETCKGNCAQMVPNHELERWSEDIKLICFIEKPNWDCVWCQKDAGVVKIKVEENKHENPKDEWNDKAFEG